MIKGAKAGQQSQRQPVIAKDSAASISYIKILYGLSEGEISGLADGAKSIYLDDTPLLDDSGNPNFKDDNGNLAVTWDFRTGTNDQEYIKGFPSVENETNINVELKGGTPYIKTVTNSQLSAVRLRLSWAALRKQETNGDVNGITIEYAIDLSTNGGAYQQVLLTKVSDKTSAKYERSHRIDLPRGSTWNIRVRRLTPNATSDLISDKMYVDAITEIIDAKLRYPNTAMLGLQYNAATFSNIAKLAVRCKGKIISVPSNYDPVTRTYTGIWNGTFKQAYSNNPAWVYYDICTQWRYGLGSRITAAMIDKWSLYALAQYCDQQVSDGKGGQEPRFTVNVYLQAQQDAFSVLQSLSSIFRAMSYWQGEQIVLDADLPKDPVYTFSRANVVDGDFSYTGTRARDRHTIAKVAWDNPDQKFKTEYEFVRDEKAIAKYGVKVLDLSIVGCTSQGQAQRAGLWALKSEQMETRTVTFKTGLDGFIPTVGSIINVSDEVLAGRANGGRVSAVSSDFLTVTLDRDVTVNAGDTLIVNANDGKAQRRIVSSVNGRAVTVSVAFNGVSSQNVWAVDSSDLKTMRFRVLSIKQDDVTFTITALQHEPQKYDAIDYGAIVDPTAISIIKPNVIDAPKNIVITQRNRVEQGQNITTMIVSWEQVSGAVAYDVEWRKDNGNWTKVPRTGNNSIEIDGVYSGNYLARVAAVSAFDLVSNFATSILTAVAGKVGAPPTIANLKATGILFGMRLDWLFAQGSSDTNYTEIQVASAPDTNVALLGTYAYPTNTATINGLQGNLTQYYRGRIVDKLGNASPWTNWVKGVTSADAQKVLDLLNGQITESQLYQDLGAKIAKITTIEAGLSKEIQDRVDAQTQEALDRSNAINQETENRIAAVKVNADAIAAERDARIADIKTNADAINQETQNRIAAVKVNADAIAAERDARIADIKTNADAINQETQNRIAAVKVNADAIAAERDARIADIKTNADAINQETQNRITGIKSVSDGLTQEIKDRQSGDSKTLEVITTYKTSNDNALAAVQSDIKTVTTAQSATASKLDGVYAIVTPLTADSDQWKADSGSKQATAWTLQSAIATGDYALASRIDTLTASVDGNSAAITSEQTARADADKAIAQRVDNYIAQTDNSIATIKQDVKTATTATTANSNAITALDNRVTTIDTNTNTAMQNAASAVSKADTAVNQAGSASSLAQTASATATNAKSVADAAKSTADTAKSTADTANTNAATAISKANAAADSASASASTLQQVQADLAGKASTGSVIAVDSKVSELSGKVTANTTKLDGVYAIVTPLTADSDQWKADSGSKQATAWTLQSAIATGDYALASRIDTLTASVDGNSAAITSEQTARADADKAIAQRVDNYIAQTDNSIATIKQDVKTATTATTANSNAITALDNRVTTIDTNTNTAMQNAASAVSKADTAVNQAGSASSLAQTASATATNAKSVADAAKSTADTAKSTADTANTNAATAISKANAAADSASASASTLQQVQADLAGKASTGSVIAVDSKVSELSGKVTANTTKLDGVYAIVTPLTADSDQWKADSGSKQATAWTLQSAIATGDYALASRIDTLTASVDGNSAAITSEQTARADADKAIAQRVDNYIAQTDNSIATIKQDVKTATTATTANSNAITALDNRVTTIDTNTNTAMQNAASAVSKADTAVNQAGSASSLAQTASATATNAQSVANTAQSTAETAKSTADTANTNAATAVNKANAAADSASATASTLQQVQADLAGKASTGSVTAVDSKVTELNGKVTANTTKLDGVYAMVVPLTADSNSWTADSGSKQATAWTLQSAIATGDNVLAQRIDVLTASVDSNAASITSEQTARADADKAITQRVDNYIAQTDSSIATIKQDVKTVTTATTANSNAITALDNRVTTIDTNTNTAMQNAASAVSKAETAVNQAGSASSLAQTASATATNAQSVANTAQSTAETAKSTADTANTNAATAVNKANAAADSASATASTLQQVQADLAGKASTGSVTAVDSKVTELNGKVTANTTKLDGVYAMVVPLTADSNSWTADSGSKQATSWTLQSAIVDGDRVISERIDTVQTTVNGNTASIQTQQQSINGLYAQYTVKVDVNGRVSGFGLASSSTQSDFAIRADKFYIAPPDGTGKGDSPFMVLTSPQVINGVTVPIGTYIKGDLIATGSISGDKITAKTEINAPIIKGGSININDKFIVKENGDLIGKSGTFEGTVLADKISGTIDVESLKKSAWLAGYKSYVSLGQVGDYAVSNVPREYSSQIVSLGSLVYSLGNNNFDVGAVLFEIKVNVQNPTTVNQLLLIVDDYVDLIVNGVPIGIHGTGRINKSISFNLTSGINTIQWLLRNTGWSTATIVLLGDFIDNQNIKFA